MKKTTKKRMSSKPKPVSKAQAKKDTDALSKKLRSGSPIQRRKARNRSALERAMKARKGK